MHKKLKLEKDLKCLAVLLTIDQFKLLESIVTDYMFICIDKSKQHLPLSEDNKEFIRTLRRLDMLFDDYRKLYKSLNLY